MDVLELKGINSKMLESSNSFQCIHSTSTDQKRRPPKESFCEFDIIENYKRAHRSIKRNCEFNKTADLVKKIEDITTRNIQIGQMYNNTSKQQPKGCITNKAGVHVQSSKEKSSITDHTNKHVTLDTSNNKRREHKSRSLMRRQALEREITDKQQMEETSNIIKNVEHSDRRKSHKNGTNNRKQLKFCDATHGVASKSEYSEESKARSERKKNTPLDSSVCENSLDIVNNKSLHKETKQSLPSKRQRRKSRRKPITDNNYIILDKKIQDSHSNSEKYTRTNSQIKNLITVYENSKSIESDSMLSKELITKATIVKEIKCKVRKHRERSTDSSKMLTFNTKKKNDNICATEKNNVYIQTSVTYNHTEPVNEHHQRDSSKNKLKNNIVQELNRSLRKDDKKLIYEIQNIYDCSYGPELSSQNQLSTTIKNKDATFDEGSMKIKVPDNGKIDRKELSFSNLNLIPVRGLYTSLEQQSVTTQTSINKIEKPITRSRSISAKNDIAIKEKRYRNKSCEFTHRPEIEVPHTHEMSKTAIAIRDIHKVAEYEKVNTFSLNTEKFKKKGCSVSSTINSCSMLSEILAKHELPSFRHRNHTISMNDKFHKSKTAFPTERIVEISSKTSEGEKISFTVKGVEPSKRFPGETLSSRVSKNGVNLKTQVFKGVEVCQSDLKLLSHGPRRIENHNKNNEEISMDSLEINKTKSESQNIFNVEPFTSLSTSSSRQSPRMGKRHKYILTKKEIPRKRRSRTKKIDVGVDNTSWCSYNDVKDSSTQTAYTCEYISPMDLNFKKSFDFPTNNGYKKMDYLPFNYKSNFNATNITNKSHKDIGVGVNMHCTSICNCYKEDDESILKLTTYPMLFSSQNKIQNNCTSVSNITLDNFKNRIYEPLKSRAGTSVSTEKSYRLHSNEFNNLSEAQTNVIIDECVSKNSCPKLKKSKSLCTIKPPPAPEKSMITCSDTCLSTFTDNSCENKKLHANKKNKENCSRIPRPQKHMNSVKMNSPPNPNQHNRSFEEFLQISHERSRTSLLDNISANILLSEQSSLDRSNKYNQNDITALEKCLNDIILKLADVSNDISPTKTIKQSHPKLAMDTRINTCIKDIPQNYYKHHEERKSSTFLNFQNKNFHEKEIFKQNNNDNFMLKPDTNNNYNHDDKNHYLELPLRNVYKNSAGFASSSGTSIGSCDATYLGLNRKIKTENVGKSSSYSLPTRLHKKDEKKFKYNKINKQKNKESPCDLKRIIKHSSSETVKSKVVILSVSSTCTIYTTPSNYLNKIQKQLTNSTVFKQDKRVISKEPFFINTYAQDNYTSDSLDTLPHSSNTTNLQPLTGLFNFSPPACSYIVYNAEIQSFKNNNNSKNPLTFTESSAERTRNIPSTSASNNKKMRQNSFQFIPQFNQNLEKKVIDHKKKYMKPSTPNSTLRDKSLEKRIYKIQNPKDVETNADISSFSDINKSCKNFVISYKPKYDAPVINTSIFTKSEETSEIRGDSGKFNVSSSSSTVKDTLISNESGYESSKTSRSTTIKRFFKKGSNLLEIFKTSSKGKKMSNNPSKESTKIAEEKSTTPLKMPSSAESFNIEESRTVVWFKLNKNDDNFDDKHQKEVDVQCEPVCSIKDEEICKETCHVGFRSMATNTQKPVCPCESTFDKQMNECQKYAEKVLLESALRKEGYLKQYNDFKEIPLDILMGKKMCRKCIEKMPMPIPAKPSKVDLVSKTPSKVSKIPLKEDELGKDDQDRKLTDKEVFDKLLSSFEKEEKLARQLSNDDEFFEEQLSLARSMESRNEILLDKNDLIEEFDADDKIRSPRFSDKPKMEITNSDCVVQPDDIGTCFARGFRPDNLMLSGDACFNLNKQDKLKMSPHMLKNTESTIDFSERETPLDFLLALGFMVDEASNALKDDDIRSRLLAAITEARVWINKITTTQGTLLYLVAYKARPDTMRYFLQLVEAIINKRISNAIKLDGFLRVLEQVEDGRIQMINILGDDKFEEEENEEKVVKKQLKHLFINVYTIAEKEVHAKNKELNDNQVSLLRILVAKYRAGLHPHLELIARYIGQGLLNTEIQLEAAMIFLSRLDTAEVKLKEFENYCGIVCEEAKQRAGASFST